MGHERCSAAFLSHGKRVIAEEGTLLGGQGEDEEKMEGVKECEMKEIKGEEYCVSP